MDSQISRKQTLAAAERIKEFFANIVFQDTQYDLLESDADEVLAFLRALPHSPAQGDGELREALEWALADIDGRARYNSEVQRAGCLARARALLTTKPEGR